MTQIYQIILNYEIECENVISTHGLVFLLNNWVTSWNLHINGWDLSMDSNTITIERLVFWGLFSHTWRIHVYGAKFCKPSGQPHDEI